jgi:SHS2 domain-containing protein
MYRDYVMSKQFEQLSHTADIQIRAYGTTLEALFRHAVIGMFQVVGPKAPGCRVENERVVCDELPISRDIETHSIDQSALLIDFLSDILSLSDIHKEAYLDATIHALTSTDIKATVHGVKVTGYEVVELKAVTYHGCEIKKVGDTWQADIVFDI